jgi:magnesium chelatase family protein
MNTAQMKALVKDAINFQNARIADCGSKRKGELTGASLRKSVNIKPEAVSLLEHAFDALGISMRAYDRMLKLARTIADLAASESISVEHVAEAIQYRGLDRQHP